MGLMGLHLHLLLLLLGPSLFWDSLKALKCFKCNLVNSTGVCLSGESFCQTQGSQQCVVKKVYRGDRLLYASQGCRDLCIPMPLFRPGARVDLVCCRDRSFCNRL